MQGSPAERARHMVSVKAVSVRAQQRRWKQVGYHSKIAWLAKRTHVDYIPPP